MTASGEVSCSEPTFDDYVGALVGGKGQRNVAYGIAVADGNAIWPGDKEE